jgi:hypothetical protein
MFLRFKKPAVNRWRGEVAARINDQWRILRLDLDALARLEARVPESSLLQFIDRITTQGLMVADVCHVLAVVLNDQAVARDEGLKDEGVYLSGGYLAAHKLAIDLLHAAFFMSPSDTQSTHRQGENDETTS